MESKKVVKSFSLPRDVAEFAESLPNASAEVTRLLRRRMLNEQVDLLVGRKASPERVAKAREWAKRELEAGRQHVESGGYEEMRRKMGFAA